MFQKITPENLPPENATCFFYNENTKHVFLGVYAYLENQGWLYLKSNGNIYLESKCIVTECDFEDLEVPTHFFVIPQIP